ncbi:hypothetical protein B0T24DRAFT_690161 [Lasiosphaeria ovina]|uniref:Uncharacterized protein n=1 Tax=Lasiosphaeria ovina TaxID=92902 RepID=A0AAE0MYH9_9PEZI|nr:hypothetical protein B0T24DRAFT_690161 [Lasiosphaeria ovina]
MVEQRLLEVRSSHEAVVQYSAFMAVVVIANEIAGPYQEIWVYCVYLLEWQDLGKHGGRKFFPANGGIAGRPMTMDEMVHELDPDSKNPQRPRFSGTTASGPKSIVDIPRMDAKKVADELQALKYRGGMENENAIKDKNGNAIKTTKFVDGANVAPIMSKTTESVEAVVVCRDEDLAAGRLAALQALIKKKKLGATLTIDDKTLADPKNSGLSQQTVDLVREWVDTEFGKDADAEAGQGTRRICDLEKTSPNFAAKEVRGVQEENLDQPSLDWAAAVSHSSLVASGVREVEVVLSGQTEALTTSLEEFALVRVLALERAEDACRRFIDGYHDMDPNDFTGEEIEEVRRGLEEYEEARDNFGVQVVDYFFGSVLSGQRLETLTFAHIAEEPAAANLPDPEAFFPVTGALAAMKSWLPRMRVLSLVGISATQEQLERLCKALPEDQMERIMLCNVKLGPNGGPAVAEGGRTPPPPPSWARILDILREKCKVRYHRRRCRITLAQLRGGEYGGLMQSED